MNRFSVSLIAILIFSPLTHAAEWDDTNDPANINAHYVYRLSDLPQSGRLDNAHMPWSDNYWESDFGGISLRWEGLDPGQLDPDVRYDVDKDALFAYTPPTKAEVLSMSASQVKMLSPAEKYDIFMSHYDYPTVTSERNRTGPYDPDWQGLCHGWVVVAANYSEPKPVVVTNAEGVKIPFGSSDVKGLLSYYYGITAYDYARGNRHVARRAGKVQYLDQVDSFDLANWITLAANALIFDQTGWSVNLDTVDENGLDASIPDVNHVFQVGARTAALNLAPLMTGRALNAGAFHVVMANQLGRLNKGFSANINLSRYANQIWNQPVVGFTSEVSDDFVHHSVRGNWVQVTTVLTYVSEIPQTYDAVVGTPMQRFSDITLSYSLDLDDQGNIIGGDWNDREHPGFVWAHDKIDIRGYFSKINAIYQPRFR